MAHARTTIRNACVTAVTSLTTTGTRVYNTRVYPLDVTQLPSLSVYTLDEEAVEDFGELSDLQMRRLTLVVEARAKATSTVEATIDTIDNEVSTALYAASLGVKQIDWRSIAVEVMGSEEQPIALGTITFELLYHVDATGPGAVIS